MKIAMINGSPKSVGSSSGLLLEKLKPLLRGEFIDIKFNKQSIKENDLEKINECNAIVIAFPLYVDSLPSHLLRCLKELESYLKNKNKTDLVVYAISNSGFYEGKQNRLAIDLIENWCEKSKIKFGQGIGVGGGAMLQSLKNVQLGKGPNINLGLAFNEISNNINNLENGDNIFINPNFPRILYKLAAEFGWRHSIKSNGLKYKDLSRKL